MKKRNLYIVLLISIVAVAAFLRLYELPSFPPGLYPDEAMNGNNALEAISTHHWKVFYPENNGREGLFINIQSLVLWVTNIREPWILRLPSAIFGILTVLGIYFLASELFTVEAGLFASLFLATNFWHINFSRIGFRAIMAPLLITWTIYFFLRAVKTREPKRKYALAVVAGIIFALGFYTYIAYRVTPLLFLLFIPFFKNERGFWKTAGVFIAATFVVALPIGLYFVAHPGDFFGRTTEISVSGSSSPIKDLALNTLKTLAMFNFRGDGNQRHNLAGSPELYWPVGILFILGVILGLWHLFGYAKKRHIVPNPKFSYLFLFVWFILALLPVVISNEGIPHALRSILLIPPVMIFAAVGMTALYHKMNRYFHDFATKLILVAFSVLLIANAFVTYFITWGPSQDTADAFSTDYVALGQILNSPKFISVPKYVVVYAGGTLVNGVAMPTQTIMFITDTYTKEGQDRKNLHYVLPEHISDIPPHSIVVDLR